MNKLKILFTSLALGALSPTFAGTIDSNFAVNATVEPVCYLTAQDINFGVVDIKAPTNSIGVVKIRCTSIQAHDLALSHGHSNNQLQRTMLGQANLDLLKYNIFTTPSYDTIIGDGANGTTHPIYGKSNGRDFFGSLYGRPLYQSMTGDIEFYLYGQIFENQYVAPDNYKDNLMITLTY